MRVPGLLLGACAAGCVLILYQTHFSSSVPHSLAGITGPTAPLLLQLPAWWWAAHLQRKPQRCGASASCMRPTPAPLLAVLDADADASPNNTFSGMRGEDRLLWEHLFYGRANGTYLEMGAVNGILLSNTRFFAQQLGWVGVLIEALPDQLPVLVQNRPESVCVNTAVCGTFSNVHYWRHLHSPLVSGIREFMNDVFLDRWYPIENGNRANIKEERVIPCVPLAYVMDCVGIHTFDLWSLDVEGAELEVLKTVDFSRAQFGVIIIEVDGKNPKKDKAVIAMLERHGYKVFWRDVQNAVFVGRHFRPSAKPGAQLPPGLSM